eukprot:966804-Karenia_brevis.AAC.1
MEQEEEVIEFDVHGLSQCEDTQWEIVDDDVVMLPEDRGASQKGERREMGERAPLATLSKQAWEH